MHPLFAMWITRRSRREESMLPLRLTAVDLIHNENRRKDQRRELEERALDKVKHAAGEVESRANGRRKDIPSGVYL
jgi:hypothetical protein